MLELVLGKEKTEKNLLKLQNTAMIFTQSGSVAINQHVARQSSEMFRLIEAARTKKRDVSRNRLYLMQA